MSEIAQIILASGCAITMVAVGIAFGLSASGEPREPKPPRD